MHTGDCQDSLCAGLTDASVLLTDLYELSMLQVYFDYQMAKPAAFEFFVRSLPPERGFLIAAGLEQALDFLENLSFSDREMDCLAQTGRFRSEFLHWLSNLRFTGVVDAMPEGTLFFANEPILRVVAPLAEAQLVESRLINILHFQTLIASKAARSRLIMRDKLLVDFGLRRAHGSEAGLLAARASYIGGFDGTATVLAGLKWAIPLYGSMAHSFVLAHRTEAEAFERFALAHSEPALLLIDTYDTEAAARNLINLAKALKSKGIRIAGVRLDSGDLASHAHRVREILDRGGLRDIRIFASSSLDEYALAELRDKKAPIDGFGVGTRMTTSADHPYLDCAYKLVEYDGRPRWKRSEGKATWPGRKQVYRQYDDHGGMLYDIVTVEGSAVSGQPLIRRVMADGRRVARSPAVRRVREQTLKQLSQLPPRLHGLRPSRPYPVVISDSLKAMVTDMNASPQV